MISMPRFPILEGTQIKGKNNKNQHPRDQFMHLTMEIFGCFIKAN
jgi:hypothetical protein